MIFFLPSEVALTVLMVEESAPLIPAVLSSEE
jgi:hypothetical protein